VQDFNAGFNSALSDFLITGAAKKAYLNKCRNRYLRIPQKLMAHKTLLNPKANPIL
jgi:hypothetical protein